MTQNMVKYSVFGVKSFMRIPFFFLKLVNFKFEVLAKFWRR